MLLIINYPVYKISGKVIRNYITSTKNGEFNCKLYLSKPDSKTNKQKLNACELVLYESNIPSLRTHN